MNKKLKFNINSKKLQNYLNFKTNARREKEMN